MSLAVPPTKQRPSSIRASVVHVCPVLQLKTLWTDAQPSRTLQNHSEDSKELLHLNDPAPQLSDKTTEVPIVSLSPSLISP